MEKRKEINKNKKKPSIEKTKLQIHGKLIINTIIATILFFISIYMLNAANNIDVENKNILISYEEKSDITYTVDLKNNKFYSTNKLGMNQQYPSLAIDKININFKYDFKTSEPSNYQYRYFTTATLVINNKSTNNINNNKLLLKRTYQLENEVIGNEINTKEYNLEKMYNIDYNTYNNFVITYKNTYNLSVESYLKVSMYVDIIDTYQNETINRSKTMEVDIPLAVNPTEISVNNSGDIKKDIYNESTLVTNNAFFNIFGILMLISSILLFLQEIRKVIISDKQQSKYINKLNKIISANSEVIVKIKNKINLKNSNLIDVETIDALLDAQNELRIPIAYFETKKNKEGYFVIVNGKQVCRYVLKVEDYK